MSTDILDNEKIKKITKYLIHSMNTITKKDVKKCELLAEIKMILQREDVNEFKKYSSEILVMIKNYLLRGVKIDTIIQAIEEEIPKILIDEVNRLEQQNEESWKRFEKMNKQKNTKYKKKYFCER